MLSSLPSLGPRDSYALWYTSQHQPPPSHSSQTPSSDPSSITHHSTAHAQTHTRRLQLHSHNRTPLARLHADEALLERRKRNVSDYGSSWLRPPGLPKSLHQIREEKKEMEEHQEALRREQLANELAEAEQAGFTEGMDGGEVQGDETGMEERDLDDDVPEAEEDLSRIDTIDDDDEEDDEGEQGSGAEAEEAVLERRVPEDLYREAIARGEDVHGGFGDVGGLSEEEDHSQILQEDDLPHELSFAAHDIDMGMDMEADLDGDVPSAEEGGYEHTDTEAELSSSEEDEEDESVDGRRLPSGGRGRTLASSLVRSDGTQNSLDLSAIDLRGSSSFVGSSPGTRGMHSAGRSRRGRGV